MERLDTLTKEISVLLFVLTVIHASAAPSLLSIVLVLIIAGILGYGARIFEEPSTAQSNVLVLLILLYASSAVTIGSLLLLDALACSGIQDFGRLTGCTSELTVFLGIGLFAGGLGYVLHVVHEAVVAERTN